MTHRLRTVLYKGNGSRDYLEDDGWFSSDIKPNGRSNGHHNSASSLASSTIDVTKGESIIELVDNSKGENIKLNIKKESTQTHKTQSVEGREDIVLDGDTYTSDEIVKFIVRTEKF